MKTVEQIAAELEVLKRQQECTNETKQLYFRRLYKAAAEGNEHAITKLANRIDAVRIELAYRDGEIEALEAVIAG